MRIQEKNKKWITLALLVVALTNGYVRGFTRGTIFNGNTKVLCLPGLNCYSCPGALAACPMGALQAVLGNSSYRMSLYVFGILAAMGTAFGRLICGWMCPFGLFQDMLYKIKIKTKRKNLPGHKYLKYLRYVILVVFPILLVTVMLDPSPDAAGASYDSGDQRKEDQSGLVGDYEHHQHTPRILLTMDCRVHFIYHEMRKRQIIRQKERFLFYHYCRYCRISSISSGVLYPSPSGPFLS